MGNKKNLLMLGVAVVVAAVITVVVYSVVTKASGRAAGEVVEVAISKIDLKPGTVLTKEAIDKGKFLKTSLPSGSFTDLSKLPGRVVVNPIVTNAPILEASLAPETLKTGGVSAIISPDKRAIGVKVDKVIGVSGFIRPNNRVDVLVNIKRLEGSNYHPINKTVLENILVLAVGPDIEEKREKGEKPRIVEVITLEVTPNEAEKLSLAAQEGKISLALRGYADNKEVLTPGHTLPALLASYSSGSPYSNVQVTKQPVQSSAKFSSAKKSVAYTKGVKAEEKKEDKPKPIVVEFIRGMKVTEVKVQEPSL